MEYDGGEVMIIDRQRIEDTLKKYDGAVLEKTDDPIYDMRLRIVLHGRPITDSRPRAAQGGAFFYNPHKEAMKRMFKPLYNKDELLQGLIIDKLMKVHMITYYAPTKETAKMLGLANIKSESFPSIITKDNDNAEKVHWDILADYEFKIFLDDNLIWHNSTTKYTSDDERVEILVEFTSDNNKIHACYDKEIRNGLKYRYMMFNPKFLKMCDLVQPNNVGLLHIYLLALIETYKLNKQRTFRKSLQKSLEYYPKELFIALLIFLKSFREDMKNMKKLDFMTLYIDLLLKDKQANYDFYKKENMLVEHIIGADLNERIWEQFKDTGICQISGITGK